MDPEMDHPEHCSTCFLASCAFSLCKVQFQSQSRQSAKLFLKSSELDSPNPSPAGECAPPRFWGEEHTRWRERSWEGPNSEGTYTVVLFIYRYFVVTVNL
jgi:hypothetical protein